MQEDVVVVVVVVGGGGGGGGALRRLCLYMKYYEGNCKQWELKSKWKQKWRAYYATG